MFHPGSQLSVFLNFSMSRQNEVTFFISIPWHLDSIFLEHYDDTVRTTVTIDDDVAKELKKRARSTEKSFKEVLNDSLRLAFSLSRAPGKQRKRFHVKAHRSAFRAGVDVEKLNQLVDQLDAENSSRSLLIRK